MFYRRHGLKLATEYKYDVFGAVAEKMLLDNGAPRSAYATLYPSAGVTPNNWSPTDAQIQWMPSLGPLGGEGGFGFDPNWQTDSDIGMEYWEITALGRVPGILRLGFWITGQSVTDDAPEDVLEFEFTSSSGWATGELPIVSYAAATPEARVISVGFRWFPAQLRIKAV